MSLASEFKSFILRGNVVDLAVGVIIGAAFGGIVTSLVDHILMPPLGAIMKGIDFRDLSVDLPGKMPNPAYKDKPKEEFDKLPDAEKFVPVKIRYGEFLQKVINFLIVAACLFFVIKAVNRLKRKEAAAPTEPSTTDKLLMEIRDALKNKS